MQILSKDTIVRKNAMINSRMFAFLLLFLFLSFTVLIQAETRIFSYIDDNGKVVYTNTPSISIKEVETTEMKIERYQNVIDNISSRFKVDPKLIHAIIVAESNYNPYAVSRKGAKGMMQLMPGTAK